MRNSKLRAFLSLPAAVGRLFLVLAIGMPVCLCSRAEEKEKGIPASGLRSEGSILPEPVTEANFAALKASSPFLRPIDLSKTLILTGIAEIDGMLVATLHDRETEKTHIVSAAANPQGWQLVSVEGDQTNPEAMTAQISVAGREVIAIRFDKHQLSPAPGRPGSIPPVPRDQAQRIAEQARNFKRGISGDGYRGPPPPELVEKLSKLSEETRGRMIYQIGEMRNRGVSSEERQKVFVQMVDRALQGRR